MLSAETKTQLQAMHLRWTYADTEAAMREPRVTIRVDGWTERDSEALWRELAQR